MVEVLNTWLKPCDKSLYKIKQELDSIIPREMVDKAYDKYFNHEMYAICGIYGLKGTGKSTLIKQWILRLLEDGVSPNKIAYIKFSNDTIYTDKMLIADIEKLVTNGITHIFINELPYINMKLGKNSLNKLSDVYATCGIKIVISGTFSYAIKLLSNDVLFDRIHRVNTNYTSIDEASRILGLNVHEKCLGDSNKILDYLQVAVVDNIAESILHSKKLYRVGYYDAEIDSLIDNDDKSELLKKLKDLTNKCMKEYLGIDTSDINSRLYEIFNQAFEDIGLDRELCGLNILGQGGFTC